VYLSEQRSLTSPPSGTSIHRRWCFVETVLQICAQSGGNRRKMEGSAVGMRPDKLYGAVPECDHSLGDPAQESCIKVPCRESACLFSDLAVKKQENFLFSI
jgi:hypothetical protein